MPDTVLGAQGSKVSKAQSPDPKEFTYHLAEETNNSAHSSSPGGQLWPVVMCSPLPVTYSPRTQPCSFMTYYLWLFSCYNGRVHGLWLQSLKYVLSGSLQKKFSQPCQPSHILSALGNTHRAHTRTHIFVPCIVSNKPDY